MPTRTTVAPIRNLGRGVAVFIALPSPSSGALARAGGRRKLRRQPLELDVGAVGRVEAGGLGDPVADGQAFAGEVGAVDPPAAAAFQPWLWWEVRVPLRSDSLLFRIPELELGVGDVPVVADVAE